MTRILYLVGAILLVGFAWALLTPHEDPLRVIQPGFNKFYRTEDGKLDCGYLRVDHPDGIPGDPQILITWECRPTLEWCVGKGDGCGCAFMAGPNCRMCP